MTTFADTGLKPALLTALEELGFEKPTPIQEQTIPHLLASKKDLIALAQTGTGKTAAFGLPLLQQINLSERRVQAIVLCPTRELCLQIAKDLERFGKYLSGLSVAAIYGGDSIGRQLGVLERGPHIVVGTPGRVNDFLERR